MSAKMTKNTSRSVRQPSVGFGIIGTGMIASFHAKAINAISNGHLVAVYGNDPEKILSDAIEKMYRTL